MKRFWRVMGRVIAFPVTGPVKAVRTVKEKAAMSIVGSVVRHVLTVIGGAGYVVSDQVVTEVASAVAVLAGVAWSIFNARKAQKDTAK